MKELSVSEFKAHALETIRQVETSGKSVCLTRRGKPVVEIRPLRESKPVAGKLAHLLICSGDVISPVVDPEDWEANR